MAAPTPTSNSVVAALVRGKVARCTLVDACGFPQVALSSYVTDGFVTVTSTKNMDMGDEIKVRQANGIIGVHEPGMASMLNYTVGVQFTRADPALLAMLTGDATVLNGATVPLVAGFEERALKVLAQNFALEVWTDTSGTPCASGARLYGYMLYPMIGQGYVTVDDISDKEVTFTVNGMSYGSPSWGRGPYGALTPTPDGSSISGPVNTAASGAPTAGRLLVAVDPAAHRHFEITPIAPPAAQTVTGPQTITLPTSY